MARAPWFARGVALVVSLAILSALPTHAARAPISTLSKDPYLGAIVVDADTGKALFEDGADVQGYPASMLKLMVLLVMLEKIEKKELKLTDQVTVTAEAARMGGSQVYLAENEVFSVEDLLYALIIQSANDAAVALAIHVAGSKDGLTALMNEKAKALGMRSTTFHSVHGLPPYVGQKPDVTTARDMTILCRELLKRPEAIKYTSTTVRNFRETAKEPFIMRTHNNLLGDFDGCDGLKTGYFRAAGYSIAATAKRDGKRVIAVIIGSATKAKRDAKAKELLSKGLAEAGK